MVSSIEMCFIRVIVYCLQIIDKIMNFFGYKLFAVRSYNILSGLTIEEKKEAGLPYNANLIRDLELGFKNDNRVPIQNRFFLRVRLHSWLRTCVNAKRAMKEYPGASEMSVINPIIIIGPHRTGTTFLHHIMAQDPRLFAPMAWELLEPTPPGRPENWRQCDRYLKWKKTMDLFQALSPRKLDTMHRVGATSVEECTIALGLVLQQMWCMARMETMDHMAERYYSRTHEEMVDMYKLYKSMLQLMAYKGMSGKRFLLKAPVHLSHLEALLEVFPGACLVFTHRSVASSLASRCSLIHHFTYDWGKLDKNYGQRMVKLTSYLNNRGAATMKKYEDKEDNPFLNIDYKYLMKNPMEAIRSIYDKSGMEFSQDIEEKFQKWLDDNPQNKSGRHEYNLADYGISERDIHENYEPYIEHMKKYGISVL